MLHEGNLWCPLVIIDLRNLWDVSFAVVAVSIVVRSCFELQSLQEGCGTEL